jgi:hypothetical protein
MRYQPGGAITGAIKLKTTTKLQPVIEEAPEPPEVQSAVRQPCQSRFIAVRLQPVGVQSKDLIFANENLWIS